MKYLSIKKPAIPVHPLVQGLGWFSIGLGLAELIFPREVSRSAGMTRHDDLLRGYGLREIATGIGLLVSSNPRPWLWGRVAGDVVDVATVVVTADTDKPGRLGISSFALLGVGLLDLYTALRSPGSRGKNRVSDAVLKDYRQRSGFPREVAKMRGAARAGMQKTQRATAAAE
jgi:hypothetical protein